MTGTIQADCFKAGDSYPYANNANAVFYMHGWVTSGLKEVTFDLWLPKRIPSNVTPSFVYVSMAARGVSGYLNNNNSFTPDRVTIARRNDYMLEVRCYFDSTIANTVNNSPVGLYVNGHVEFS